MTTTQLYPGAAYDVHDAGWRCFIAGFEIDPGGTMPTIEQQLNVLMQ
jgi:hypothetical protein